MLTDTIIEDERWAESGLETLAESAARAALSHLGLDPERHEIAVLGCDDDRIATLNETFRGRAAPTNVLSWPAFELAPEGAGGRPDVPPESPETEPVELGDIAIAWETCLREAEAGDLPFGHHVIHLVVHGTLHLLGYDHVRDDDATLMEGIECAILEKLGVPNPYDRERASSAGAARA